MRWLIELWSGAGTAHQLFALALVATSGLALGRIQIKGVGLGVAGVLFSGLTLSYLGLRADGHVVEFVREFGLILFVFSIGLQLGPGFFSSLRRDGLKLNVLAACNVALGVAMCLAVWAWGRVPTPAALGLLSGATTNTPSLAAAQQVFSEAKAADEVLQVQGLSYALAYPLGIAGVIASMLLAKRFTPRAGAEATPVPASPTMHVLHLAVRNPALAGQSLSSAFSSCRSVTISRLGRAGRVVVPAPDLRLQEGDVLLAVGESAALEQARLVAGGVSDIDLRVAEGPVVSRRMIVTHREVIGRTLGSLGLRERRGVAATRLVRHGVELVPDTAVRLQFGDVLMLVGTSDAITDVARLLGDAPKELDHARIGPLFFGICLGVLLGVIPVALPGLPAPLRLGLAGGPLVVALLLGRLGSVGRIVWYVPHNASLALREIGIVLFLACVGLKSGDRFFEYLLDGRGLDWMAWGALITCVPVFLTAFLARAWLGLSVPETCGVLAGAMTDPPALAYAQQVHEGNRPALAYATVYPLTMLLRVLSVQCLALFLP